MTNSRVPQLKVGLDLRLFTMSIKIKSKVSFKLDGFFFGPFDHAGEVIYYFAGATGQDR